MEPCRTYIVATCNTGRARSPPSSSPGLPGTDTLECPWRLPRRLRAARGRGTRAPPRKTVGAASLVELLTTAAGRDCFGVGLL